MARGRVGEPGWLPGGLVAGLGHVTFENLALLVDHSQLR